MVEIDVHGFLEISFTKLINGYQGPGRFILNVHMMAAVVKVSQFN